MTSVSISLAPMKHYDACMSCKHTPLGCTHQDIVVSVTIHLLEDVLIAPRVCGCHWRKGCVLAACALSSRCSWDLQRGESQASYKAL